MDFVSLALLAVGLVANVAITIPDGRASESRGQRFSLVMKVVEGLLFPLKVQLF